MLRVALQAVARGRKERHSEPLQPAAGATELTNKPDILDPSPKDQADPRGSHKRKIVFRSIPSPLYTEHPANEDDNKAPPCFHCGARPISKFMDGSPRYGCPSHKPNDKGGDTRLRLPNTPFCELCGGPRSGSVFICERSCPSYRGISFVDPLDPRLTEEQREIRLSVLNPQS